MKKILILLTMSLFLLFATFSDAQTGKKKSSKSSTHSSGTYQGGKGSSHKGGKYKNASTNNHYRKRK